MIIGIDASLSCTAVVVIGDDGNVDTSEAIKSKYSKDRFKRYSLLCEGIFRWITHDDSVYIEGYSYGSKGKGVSSMYEFGGILRYKLWSLKVDYTEVPPTVIKKFVTGKGNANKTQVMKCLIQRYGADFGTDDEYDAYGVALVGHALEGKNDKLFDYQKEAIKKLMQRQSN